MKTWRNTLKLSKWHEENLPLKKSYSLDRFEQVERSKIEKSQLTNSHFMSISGHFFANYLDNFHKTEVLMVILRCIVCLHPNWIKSNNMILVKTYFCHAWKCIISGLIYQSEFWYLWGIQLSYFQNGYFTKILWGFHETHNQVKIKLFFELFTNKILNMVLCFSFQIRLYHDIILFA